MLEFLCGGGLLHFELLLVLLVWHPHVASSVKVPWLCKTGLASIKSGDTICVTVCCEYSEILIYCCPGTCWLNSEISVVHVTAVADDHEHCKHSRCLGMHGSWSVS